MEKAKSRIHLPLIYGLIAIQFVLSFFFAAYFLRAKQSVSSSEIFNLVNKSEKFTMYIGTNDKDTYRREIPLEECRRRIDSICNKYVDGFSAGEMRGKWVDETGFFMEEDTFVYVFYDASDEAMKKIMDDVIVELNQNTILIEKEHVTSAFYGRK